MDEPIMKELLNVLPQVGNVTWIGVRKERIIPPISVEKVQVLATGGLEGDRYKGGLAGKRQVTLIQGEHLDALASILGKENIDPGLIRRNIVVRGINLLALRDRQFHIGEAILEGTGYCHPCSRMEENLGKGGYNAMRGHGGITARVIQAGTIQLGDSVALKP